MIGKLTNKDKIALLFMTILALAALIYGFSVIPSPGEEQKIGLDQKRVSDLGELQASINTHYQTTHALPQTLNEINTNSYDQSSPLNTTDPQTKEPYEYNITGFTTYQLCATFTTDSSKQNPTDDYGNTTYYSSFSTQFQHPAGHYCFPEKVTSYGYSSGIVPPLSPLPLDKPASLSAILSSSYKNGNCQWTPTFYLKGFAPYSQIRVYWEGTLSETCTGKANQKETSSTQLNEQTDANGALLIGGDPEQVDFGEYMYTFTDSEGNSASVHVTFDPNSLRPTILPTKH